MFIFNCVNVMPPPRYDGLPWTKVQVWEGEYEEAEPLLEHPFEKIDEIAISTLTGGVDSEPAEPKPRDFTITANSQEPYVYFVFVDANGFESQKIGYTHNAFSVQQAIHPALTELGALLRYRTVEALSGGREAGTFNTNTRPTAEEAKELIGSAINQTLLKTGPNIAPQFWQQAKTVILYATAMLVELSFYKDDLDKGISAYPEYKEAYGEALKGLIDSINGVTAASPTLGPYTIPVVTRAQANFQALIRAIDPKTGKLDPRKIPPDMNYPLGPGGLPPWFYGTVNGWPNAVDMGYSYGSDSFLDDY